MKALKLFLLDRTDYCKVSTEEINAAIIELEELIKPKSCNGCKHLLTKSRICTKQVQLHNGSLPENFYCNRYEPKEIK